MALDIAGLRQDCRDKQFCLSISPSMLADIIDALLASNKDDSKHLIPTVCNILLLNRSLHTSCFTPRYAHRVLAFLNAYCKDADTSDYPLMIAIYRLMFLVFYDIHNGVPPLQTSTEKDQKEKEVDKDQHESHDRSSSGFADANKADLDESDLTILETESILNNALDRCFSNLDALDNQQYTTLVVEVLKALSTLYHNLQHLFVSRSIARYIEGLSAMDLSRHLLVTKYITNTLVMICTINITNSPDCCIDKYTDQQAKIFISCLVDLLAFKLMGRHADPDIEINDLTHLVMLIGSLSKLMNQSRLCSASLKSFLYNKLFPQSDSVPEVYLEIMRLLSEQHSNNLPVSDYTRLGQFQSYFVQCAYYVAQLRGNSTVTFLEWVGYALAKDFIDANNVDLTGIDVSKYLAPKYAKDASLTSVAKISDTLRSIAREPKDHVEMTQEQKELEAEKLFVLFERMEKTKVFQGFKNPVREWQQSGRFEGIE